MSAIRSLSGEDRTWRRQPNSVENDSERTFLDLDQINPEERRSALLAVSQ
jgi:hypothetical protein